MEASRKNQRTFFSMMHASDQQTAKCGQQQAIESIRIPFHRIEEELQLYEWRRQHSGQVISYHWIKLEPYNQREVTFFLKPMQKLTNLTQIKLVKGSRIIKGISKIFLSFAELYQKFGPFDLSQDMIAFDTFYDPFVWLNGEYTKNEYRRDHISEVDFASNILYMLLKNDQKFENHQLLDCCCELKGQAMSLKQIAAHFNDFYEKEIQLKKKIPLTKSISQQSTLSFTKKSKIKRNHGLSSKIKMANQQNSQVYRSFLNNNNENSAKCTFQKSSSLKNLKFEPILSDHQWEYAETEVKTNNALRQSNMEQYKQQLFLPAQDQLQVSIDFGNESSLQIVKEVIELEKLDRFNRVLATSINMNDRD